MSRVHYGTFSATDLSCPICQTVLLPPDPNICEHIAFYWVLGPTEDPFFEFLLPEYEIAPDDLMDEGNLVKLSKKYDLQIHALDEENAEYPTQVILGVSQSLPNVALDKRDTVVPAR